MKSKFEIINAEIERLEKGKKHIDNADSLIKQLQNLKDKMENFNDYRNIIQWQEGLKTKYLVSGLTMKELGLKVGVSKQTIAKWVNQRVMIPKKRALQLSNILNYPLSIKNQ